MIRIILFALLHFVFSNTTDRRDLQGVKKVIYDSDNRQDLYEREAANADDMWVKIGKESIAAIMRVSDLGLGEYEVTLPSQTLKDFQQMCDGERFSDQLAAARCSATLVDSKHVVTAGHCIDKIPCGEMALVFNYYVTGHDFTNGYSYQTITVNDIYKCLTYVRENNDLKDYAYIELEREVDASSGHFGVPKMEIGKDARVSPGEPVVVIGFGSGLPMKIDDGATVYANDAGKNLLHYSSDFAFKASFDTFGGNSGSGVFKADGTLIGIHVIGNNDYNWYEDGQGGRCKKNAVMPTGSAGEETQNYLYLAMNDICTYHDDCDSQTEYCSNMAGGLGQCRPSTSAIENFPVCKTVNDAGRPVQCCKYDNDCKPQDDIYCCNGKPFCTTNPEYNLLNGLVTCSGITTGQTLVASSRNPDSCVQVTFVDDGSATTSTYFDALRGLGIKHVGSCKPQYDKECNDANLNTAISELEKTLKDAGLAPTITSKCCDGCNRPQCPDDGGLATCCDLDGSCTSGNDDWCCGSNGDEFYCSSDSQSYAEDMGGILCPDLLIDCNACASDFKAADLCRCLPEDSPDDCETLPFPDSCDATCEDVVNAACKTTNTNPENSQAAQKTSFQLISLILFAWIMM